jgi:hypothetical protein
MTKLPGHERPFKLTRRFGDIRDDCIVCTDAESSGTATSVVRSEDTEAFPLSSKTFPDSRHLTVASFRQAPTRVEGLGPREPHVDDILVVDNNALSQNNIERKRK